jgi:FkbM family methyltransferase
MTGQASMSDRYFYLGPDAALVRLQDGHFLFVDPQDETVSAHLIGRGYWEVWIQQTLASLLKPGQRAIEVGANTGVHTMTMARAVGEAGRVTTVEANPRLANLLARSIDYNGYSGRLGLYRGAANDTDGELDFQTSRRNGGGGHTFVYDRIFGDETVTVRVPAARLDTMVAEPVDFIRLDAEGSEPQILAGAVNHLSNPAITICMEWDVFQMSMRTKVKPFVQGLIKQGFKFWRIEHDLGLTALPGEEMATMPHCEVLISRVTPGV